jgi:phosphoserine aminotransferase
MPSRIHNFNPGPAALPLSVLEEVQAEMLDFKGSGMSITEVSHRSSWFDDVINDAAERVKRLLNSSGRSKHSVFHGSYEHPAGRGLSRLH